jgi:2-polyprenyl-3-methyl-5-hydroxy-6-metoxy-1,4-benzoquinol methylase
MNQWYEQLFENYGHRYDQESFTQGTAGECDFIETEINFNKQTRILDIGCGTGRHALELAKRGYRVTGIDLSEPMLRRAKEKATAENLTIDFRQQDARALSFLQEFDLVIMLCEGGFPLMETDEMNYEILKGASKALKDKGKFIFTTLNGLFPLFHSVKDFLAESAKDDHAEYKENTFDLMTFRDHSKMSLMDDHGQNLELECNERYYVPSEISWQLKSLGFSHIHFFGAKLGAFSRNDKLQTDNFEMLVVAERYEAGNSGM